MYTAFYALREKPFSLTPDPRYLFPAASHREALAHTLYGIDEGEGFISVTGEVGTGKTTLCRTLVQRLGPEIELAFVFNPVLQGDDLLRAISAEFGLPVEGISRRELNEQLNEFLLEMNRAGRRVLLIVDEAQNLSAETLEEIRLLSNLETTNSKLIQILLFGQPELDEKLDSKELRQLRQRIGVRWSLGPMSRGETREYVRHRLRIANGAESDLFSDSALREVYRRTRGVPRLVNLLCDRALLAGYASSAHRIGADRVRRAARELEFAYRRRQLRRWIGLRRGFVAVLFAAVLGALGWLMVERADWALSRGIAVGAAPTTLDSQEEIA
jgi:general secretion pathway protein A